MEITLNGQAHRIDGEEIALPDLIASLNLGPQPVLVELNGEALFQRDFADHQIKNGDVVEIIRMVAGG
ncbi:MAG: sulfur carrier protein ThiS [Verrucomicrobiota bacterium]